MLVPGIAPAQVQEFIELHEVHSGPLLKPAKAPVDGILSLKQMNSTTQLFVIHKLAEGYNPTMIVAGVGLFTLFKNGFISLFPVTEDLT